MRSRLICVARSLPPQDSVGRHDDQGLPPAGPDSGQPDPQEAISRAQLRPGHSSPVHGKLLAKGQVFQGELTLAAGEERQEHLVAGRSIGERQFAAMYSRSTVAPRPG